MEFIEAFLIHVLPKGFCRVRFSGYLCNCKKVVHLPRGVSLKTFTSHCTLTA
ncbi:MAG: transposase [Roseburia inulinivorans]